MNAGNDKPWDARLAARLVAPLRGSWVTPNHLTTLRMLFGVLACTGLSHGGYLWTNIGALCFAASNFLDHTDGELARITGKTSRFGHLYDLTADALVNFMLFLGIGIGLRHSELGASAVVLGLLAGIAVAAIFHLRHEIELIVGKARARQPNIGALEAEDILYALPLVTLAGSLHYFLLLAAVGAPLFALWVLREYLTLRRAALP